MLSNFLFLPSILSFCSLCLLLSDSFPYYIVLSLSVIMSIVASLSSLLSSSLQFLFPFPVLLQDLLLLLRCCCHQIIVDLQLLYVHCCSLLLLPLWIRTIWTICFCWWYYCFFFCCYKPSDRSISNSIIYSCNPQQQPLYTAYWLLILHLSKKMMIFAWFLDHTIVLRIVPKFTICTCCKQAVHIQCFGGLLHLFLILH